MSTLSYEYVYALGRSVGLTKSQAVIATAIAAAESGLNPNNIGDATLSKYGSRGLWQIFTHAHSPAELGIGADGWDLSLIRVLEDPRINAHAMWLISNHGTNWHPWSTYQHNSHLKYIPHAQSAADKIGENWQAVLGGSTVTHVVWRGVTLDDRTRDMMIEVDKLLPKIPIHPSQGSYHKGVSASAGTHDGGGAIDISVRGLSLSQINTIVRTMRLVGFAAWHRYPSEGPWGEHIHAIAVGCKDMTQVAANQVTALRRGYNGLGHLGLGGKDRHADMKLPVISWEQYKAKRDGIPSVPPVVSYVLVLGPGVKPNTIAKNTFDLQRALIAAGYADFTKPTGFYGKGTQAAVNKFLRQYPQFSSGRTDVIIGQHGWTKLRELALTPQHAAA